MRTRLFILVLLASPTLAADEDSASKRTCDDATYTRLVEAKTNACDRAGPMKCTQNMTCAEIPDQIIKLNACIAARRAVMDTCYKGGDEGHNRQVQNLENAIETCFKYLERCRRNDESCKE